MTTTRPSLRILLTITATTILAVTATAQFNIDLDHEFAPPHLGGGAPSSAFGAAANQPGFWNKIAATGMVPTQLRDLNGAVTSIVMSGPSGGSSTGFNNPNNTGDYALLLNDGRSGGASYSFAGLPTGFYKLFTYAVSPSGEVNNTAVTVAGAVVPTLFVTGPMPGNAFVSGVTHSAHDIHITNGILNVHIADGAIPSYINGLQIVAVPEPATCLALVVPGLLLLMRRRR